MSAVTPEIVFQHMIAQAIFNVKQQPDIVRHLMRNFPSGAQDDAVKYMLKEHFRIVTQFPRTDVTFPMIWIGLRNEVETSQVLGDFLGSEPCDDETYDLAVLGSNSVAGTGSVSTLKNEPKKITEGLVSEESPTADEIIIDQDLDNTYIGCEIVLTGGKGQGQKRVISRALGEVLEVSEDWDQLPDTTTSYKILDPTTVTQNTVGTPPKLYPAGTQVRMVGSAFKHDYIIQVMSSTPHAVLFLYTLLKAIMYTNKPVLHDNGIHHIMLNGSDMLAHPELLPDHVFSRSLNVSCVSYFTVPELISAPISGDIDLDWTLCADGQDPIQLVSLE
jgi:hypothetical protein